MARGTHGVWLESVRVRAHLLAVARVAVCWRLLCAAVRKHKSTTMRTPTDRLTGGRVRQLVTVYYRFSRARASTRTRRGHAPEMTGPHDKWAGW